MSETDEARRFAKRRPDWQLPELSLDLQLHPMDALEQASSRQPCPKCQRSRFLYCYGCVVPFTAVPSLQLPFQVSIITHHAEQASKNTGVHAALLCPDQVQLHSIEQLPVCDVSRCAVLYPSDDALLPDQLDVAALQRVIIIDSKWAKAKELNQHQALQGMKRVKLPGNPKSCFWRFHTQGVTDEGVCTIEALHRLLQAMAGRLPDPPYQGDPNYFDNLLWYFAFQHQLVAQKAAERQQKMMQQQGGNMCGYREQQSRKKEKQQQQQAQQQQQHTAQQEEHQQQHQGQSQQGGHEQQQLPKDSQQRLQDAAQPQQLLQEQQQVQQVVKDQQQQQSKRIMLEEEQGRQQQAC